MQRRMQRRGSGQIILKLYITSVICFNGYDNGKKNPNKGSVIRIIGCSFPDIRIQAD